VDGVVVRGQVARQIGQRLELGGDSALA
jgi:hypothetical protein